MKHVAHIAACFSLALATPAHADILIDDQDNIIECKLLRFEQKEVKRKLVKVYVVQVEGGETKNFTEKQVKYFVKRATSWEKRAEDKEWYDKNSSKVKDRWKDQESFARQCISRDLSEQSLAHFRKAYELRKAEQTAAPKKGKDREKELMDLADWLERCDLFNESLDERRALYALKKEGATEAPAMRSLGEWCLQQELLEEARDQFQAALKLDPSNRTIEKKVADITRSLDIPIDKTLYKSLRVRFLAAAKYVRSRQNQDGSIGADISEAGVHGHRAMSALGGMTLLAEWDFAVLTGKASADEIPPELLKVLDFVLTFRITSHQAGDDVWGPIFALDFLLRCHERRQFNEGTAVSPGPGTTAESTQTRSSYKDRLARGIKELIEDLDDLQRKDGGWYYYNFVDDSASFVTAPAVINLIRARDAGFDISAVDLEAAIKKIQSLKTGEGTYTYMGDLPQGPVGACARSTVCELAMMVAGKGSQEDLRRSIDIFFRYRPLLEGLMGLSDTHIGKGKTAPYYLLFSHYWTTRAIKHLDKSKRRGYLQYLCSGLAAYQKADATFGDWSGTKEWRTYGSSLAALCFYNAASLALEVGQELKDK